MIKSVWLLFATFLLVLGGCSTTPNCLKPQPYMQAKTFPPLKSPAGLDVPEPDASMQIPEIASGPVGAFDSAPENRNPEDPAARCLITPPAMG